MELMIENKIRQLAKKILHVKSFRELHDIIMEYAKDELEFVEFPDSLDKFIPTGDHEKWPEKFPTGIPEGDNESLKKFREFREMYNDSEKKSFDDLKDLRDLLLKR